jgi:hypothetical protein
MAAQTPRPRTAMPPTSQIASSASLGPALGLGDDSGLSGLTIFTEVRGSVFV